MDILSTVSFSSSTPKTQKINPVQKVENAKKPIDLPIKFETESFSLKKLGLRQVSGWMIPKKVHLFGADDDTKLELLTRDLYLYETFNEYLQGCLMVMHERVHKCGMVNNNLSIYSKSINIGDLEKELELYLQDDISYLNKVISGTKVIKVLKDDLLKANSKFFDRNPVKISKQPFDESAKSLFVIPKSQASENKTSIMKPKLSSLRDPFSKDNYIAPIKPTPLDQGYGEKDTNKIIKDYEKLLTDLKNDNLYLWSMIKNIRQRFGITKDCPMSNWEYNLDNELPVRLIGLWEKRESLVAELRTEPNLQRGNPFDITKVLSAKIQTVIFKPIVSRPPVKTSIIFQGDKPITVAQVQLPIQSPVPKYTNYDGLYSEPNFKAPVLTERSKEILSKLTEQERNLVQISPEGRLYKTSGSYITWLDEDESIKNPIDRETNKPLYPIIESTISDQQLKSNYPELYEYFRSDLNPSEITIQKATDPVKVVEVKVDGDFIQAISSTDTKDVQGFKNKLKELSKKIFGKLPQFTFLSKGSKVCSMIFPEDTDISSSAIKEFADAVAAAESDVVVNVKVSTIEGVFSENLTKNFGGEITEEKLKDIEPAKACIDATDATYEDDEKEKAKRSGYIPVPPEYRTRESKEECAKPADSKDFCAPYGKKYVPYLHHDTATGSFQACCTELKELTTNTKLTKTAYLQQYNNIRRKAYDTLVQFYDNIVIHNNTLIKAIKEIKKKITSNVYNKVARIMTEYVSSTDALKHDINDCLSLGNDKNKECMNLHEFLNNIVILYEQHNDAYSKTIAIVQDLNSHYFTKAYQSADSLAITIKKFASNIWTTFKNKTYSVTMWAKRNKFYVMVMGHGWCSALVPVVQKLGSALTGLTVGSSFTGITTQIIQIFTTTLFSLCDIISDPIYLGLFMRWVVSLLIKCLNVPGVKTMLRGIIKLSGLGLVVSAYDTASGLFSKKKQNDESDKKANKPEPKDYFNNEEQIIKELKAECNSNWILTGVMNNVSVVTQAVATILAGYISTYLSWFFDLGCFVGETTKKTVDVGGDIVGRVKSFAGATYAATTAYFLEGKDFMSVFNNRNTVHSNYGTEFSRQIMSSMKDAATMLSNARDKGSMLIMLFEALPFPAITAITVMALYFTYVDPAEIPEGEYETFAFKNQIEEMSKYEEDITSAGKQKSFVYLT